MQKMHVEDSLGVGIHACGGDLMQPFSNDQNGPLFFFVGFLVDEILPSSVEHCKDPHETTSMLWKLRVFSSFHCVHPPRAPGC